jgi:hypothetical protein
LLKIANKTFKKYFAKKSKNPEIFHAGLKSGEKVEQMFTQTQPILRSRVKWKISKFC